MELKRRAEDTDVNQPTKRQATSADDPQALVLQEGVVLEQLIQRLGCKEIGRCMLVCKGWKDLFSKDKVWILLLRRDFKIIAVAATTPISQYKQKLKRDKWMHIWRLGAQCQRCTFGTKVGAGVKQTLICLGCARTLDRTVHESQVGESSHEDGSSSSDGEDGALGGVVVRQAFSMSIEEILLEIAQIYGNLPTDAQEKDEAVAEAHDLEESVRLLRERRDQLRAEAEVRQRNRVTHNKLLTLKKLVSQNWSRTTVRSTIPQRSCA